MICTLVGKYRNTYVTSEFENDVDGEAIGLEASELKFDYDSVGELPDKLPCRVNIEFDRKGKIRSVEVLGNDGK